MINNKKGFTLVELLAVIVILALIITIAIPSAIGISHKIKVRMYEKKVPMILSAAELFGADNSAYVVSDKSECSTKSITVNTLLENGYLKSDDKDNSNIVKNPVDDQSMNNLQICIYKNNRRVYAITYGTWPSY